MKNKAVLLSAMFAVLGVVSGPAHAVPILIEFAGMAEGTSYYDWVSREPLRVESSWDDALLGQAVTGRITIETDGLNEVTTSTPGYSTLLLYNSSADPIRLVTSELTIGGLDYSPSAYTNQNVSIALQDALWPDRSDTIFIQRNYSQGPQGALVDGHISGSGVSLQWTDLSDPHGLVDSSLEFDPLRLALTLNSLPVFAQYNTWINACAEGVCRTITQSHTPILLSSFLVHTPSVPEPGTLGLFAAGLLGIGIARRRQRQR